MDDLKAYEITWHDIPGYYAAKTRGRARYRAALALKDLWALPTSKAFKELKCRRAPWVDANAVALGREDWLDAR